jgi:hypothetical protein
MKELEKMKLGEIANLYKVDKRTFRNQWINPHEETIGPPAGYYYTPQQIRKMFELFDPPKGYKDYR